jgi:hypothetical protein
MPSSSLPSYYKSELLEQLGLTSYLHEHSCQKRTEINSLEHEKSKHTCIFIYYHLPNVGAVGSEVLVLVSVEELSFGHTQFLIFMYFEIF